MPTFPMVDRLKVFTDPDETDEERLSAKMSALMAERARRTRAVS